jgi:hypothetical protein
MTEDFESIPAGFGGGSVKGDGFPAGFGGMPGKWGGVHRNRVNISPFLILWRNEEKKHRRKVPENSERAAKYSLRSKRSSSAPGF